MPTYEYKCNACSYSFREVQSIKAEALLTCLECGENALQRVFHAVPVLSRGEPKTLIQQADRNEQKWGRQELEERRHKHKESGAAGRRAANRKKPKRPWWRKTEKVNTQLADLAPNVSIEKGKIVKSEPLTEKATDYIMTGKI